MDNQHRQISGYRELSQDEIDLMNEIKRKSEELGALVAELQSKECRVEPDQRWVAIGKNHLQQGFMALTRAIAKPTTF